MKDRKNAGSAAEPFIPGVSFSGEYVRFVFAAARNAVTELLLFRGKEAEPFQTVLLPETEKTGLFRTAFLKIPGDGTCTYLYRVNGIPVTDPYAKCLVSVKEESCTVLRGVLKDPVRAIEPAPSIPYEDCVFYKLHVRGFTMQKSGVRCRGTFEGLRESIPYLKELGVSALLMMPVYEFDEYPMRPPYTAERMKSDDTSSERKARRNYWGYTRGLYFCPKLSYCATEEPDREFSGLIDALHREGMLCIPEFWFHESEDPRFVTDVLRHWYLTYGVDGFRLAGGGAWTDAVRRDPLLWNTKLIVSGSDEEACVPGSVRTDKRFAVYSPQYEFCMRRFLKGDLNVSLDETAWMLRRNAVSFAFLSYMADQDGYTLADAVSYEEKHNEANGEENRDGSAENHSWNCGEEGPSKKASVRKLREKQIRNALMMLFTTQSTPLLYAGDEMFNTQHGNNNAWCQDNETGWVNWNRTKQAASLREFVKEAAAFRKQHPVLKQAGPLRMADYRSCGIPDLSYHGRHAWIPQHPQMKCALGVLYGGSYAEKTDGSDDDTLYILYNMYWQEQAFALPDLPDRKNWYVKADTNREEPFYRDGEEPRAAETDKTVSVPARTICILIAKPE